MTIVAIDPVRILALEGIGERDHAPDHDLAVEDTRILVVDDDPTAARLMVRLLERDGFRRVVSVGDGGDAVAVILDERPEVIVLDVHMPRVDGFQVLRQVQNDEDSMVIAVLAVSGDASIRTSRAMMNAGADDFISRPFDGRQFALRVRRLARVTRELRRTVAYLGWLEEHAPEPHSMREYGAQEYGAPSS
jgi:DNA-binding response OmpR family regulator